MFSKPYSPVETFRRYFKHEPTLFPSFKDQALWDNWNHNAVATSWTQDVEDIFHEAYLSSNPDEISLFNKKKYIYSVFDKILLTDQEKKIVRKHEADKDAQKVYAKLSTLAVKHTKDLLNSSELLTYITPARLGNGYYTSTTGSFIINFNDQNRIYETLVDISDHLSGVQKRTMLENIVGPIPYLKYAKNQSDQSKKM